MEKVEKVTWPKPSEDFLHATFDLFSAKHPWVGTDAIRPKGIARDIYESSSTFDDWVKRMEITRVEGVLLRYLGQVHNTLEQSVPEALKTDEVEDMVGFFRAMIGRVDSSLLEAWENLVQPGANADPKAPSSAGPREYDLVADPKALRARIRGELQQLVGALASKRFEDAGHLLNPESQKNWPPHRFEEALAPYFEEYEVIIRDTRSRQAHLPTRTKV